MKDIQQQWSEILEQEWLGELQGFDEVVHTQKRKILTILDIPSLEDTHKVKFYIDTQSQIIELYTHHQELIWYVKPGFYTYGNISWDTHLEMKVFEEFSTKWFWQMLFDVYRWLGFYIPTQEYSHTPTMIRFLQKNWYTLVWKFDENAQLQELSQQELYQLDNDIEIAIQNGSSELLDTYYFVYK